MNQTDNLNYEPLKKNISDFIKEEQIKLGYRSESISLYYPLSSLNRFFGTECSVSEMAQMLVAFSEQVKVEFGEITISNRGERFC